MSAALPVRTGPAACPAPFYAPYLAGWRTPTDPGDAGAALAFRDPSDYALTERVAALSMLAPADASPFVGFRCVRNSGANS